MTTLTLFATIVAFHGILLLSVDAMLTVATRRR